MIWKFSGLLRFKLLQEGIRKEPMVTSRNERRLFFLLVEGTILCKLHYMGWCPEWPDRALEKNLQKKFPQFFLRGFLVEKYSQTTKIRLVKIDIPNYGQNLSIHN